MNLARVLFARNPGTIRMFPLMSDTLRELRSTLAPLLGEKSEPEKRLELIGGGVIELWLLDSTDAGRGRKYALVFLDEAATIPGLEDAWQKAIRPTLTDLQGKAEGTQDPGGGLGWLRPPDGAGGSRTEQESRLATSPTKRRT